jgi:hypothetical protein
VDYPFEIIDPLENQQPGDEVSLTRHSLI